MTEPTDAELQALWVACDHPLPQNYARAVLTKWGQPAQATKCECTMAQRCTGSGCRYCNPQEYIDMLHDQIADSETAQAAEPVLFALQWPEDRAAGRICVSVIFDNEAEAKDYAASCTDVTILPLFTPPQPVAREPLTPEQIATAGEIEDNDSAFLAGFSTGARFAEQHHGIKGGQHGDAKP